MESRPPKVKLSKHLLEMKFMKRSALRLEKEAHEIDQQHHIDDEHWILDLPGLQEHQNKYVTERSFVACENLMFGRMAFKNFNPEIEKLMKVKSSEDELAQAGERERELGVSEEEMADRYSSLVGTIGKKFGGKRKRVEESDEEEVETIVKVSRERVTSGLTATLTPIAGGGMHSTSEQIGSTLAQIRKEVDLKQDTRGNMEENVGQRNHKVQKKNSKKSSPAVLDYYKKKSNKGFMKPSD